MFWKTIRGWSDSNMEPSLSLVSIIVYFITIVIDSSLHSTASPSTSVRVAICTLPEELTPKWDKESLGDQMVTNMASLLKSDNGWQSKSHSNLFDSTVDDVLGNVPGLHNDLATLSMTCRACDVLVSSMLQFSLYMVECML